MHNFSGLGTNEAHILHDYHKKIYFQDEDMIVKHNLQNEGPNNNRL